MAVSAKLRKMVLTKWAMMVGCCIGFMLAGIAVPVFQKPEAALLGIAVIVLSALGWVISAIRIAQHQKQSGEKL